jgi:leucyl aminopeptidase (aminopeptidase T)
VSQNIHNPVDKAVENLADNLGDIPRGRVIVVLHAAEKTDLAAALADVLARRGARPQLRLVEDAATLGTLLPALLSDVSLGMVVLAAHALLPALAPWLETSAGEPRLRGQCSPRWWDLVTPTPSLLRLYTADPADTRGYLGALQRRLPDGASLRVTAPGGTDLRLTARTWLAHPWELLTAPIEESVEGCIVADASVFFSRVRAPITVEIARGRIARLACADAEDATFRQYVRWMDEAHQQDAANAQLAELGIGGNGKAELSGIIMEDEAVRGTCHFCFGDNAPYSGRNPSVWHGGTLVVREPRFAVLSAGGADDDSLAAREPD